MAIDLDALVLNSGAHKSREQGMCVMEAVAYFAGEPHSDHPACVCPTIGAFLRNWNDSVNNPTRQKLKPYIARVIGTAGDGNEMRRSWMCFDWLTRECAPAFLDLAKLSEQAATLRALSEIHDRASLDAAMPALATAQKAATAAWDRAAAGAAAWDRAAAGAAAWAAAWDAAWAAAWAAARAAAWDAAGAAARAAAARDAAWDAAWAAARDAARDAAWAAARDAARDAAGDAAGAAAGATLVPVVERLQISAFSLLDRMIELPRAGEEAC